MTEKKRNVRAPKSVDVIRLRPGQFIGDNSTCDHLIHECIDNFLDELRNNFGDTAGISFSKNGDILVFDNGRGLPIGEAYDEEKKETVDSVELLFTKLHSGTKFSLDDDSLDSLFGQNGVGLVAVNALSDYVDVRTRHNDEIWHYLFKDGILDKKEKVDSIKFSTEIIFHPSSRFFKSTEPNKVQFLERLKLAQVKIPNGKFYFNLKSLPQQSFDEFVRCRLELSDSTPLFQTSYKTKLICVDQETGKKIQKPTNIDIFLTYENGETIIDGDVNLRFCEGTFLNNIQSLIKNILPSKLDKKFQKAPERFLIEGLRLYASLQYPTPQFDSQTKTRFISDVKKDIILPMENNLSKILSEKHIKKIVEEILNRKLSTSAVSKKVKKISSDNKLCDCLNHGEGSVLYVVEGDSAASVFYDARDGKNEAIMPLRGKCVNVETQTLVKINENKELKHLSEAMGQYPYRYQKIKIAADSDPDGHHIIVLVLLIFLKFYPEIVDEGRLSILLPPLYGAKKDKEFIPIYNVKEFNELQKVKKGFTFQRFKGLGELISDNMRKVLDNNTEYVIKTPKSKKIIDKLLKIITDTDEKRKYLEKLEFNFESFIEEVFENKEKNR